MIMLLAVIRVLAVFNTSSIRVVTLEGDPWFVAADVLRCLGYGEKTIERGTTATLRPLDADQKKVIPLKTLRGAESQITVVSESGLYALSMRAQKRRPHVKAFQDWVTKEVLPSIRKTGSFVTGQPSLVENPQMTAREVIMTPAQEMT